MEEMKKLLSYETPHSHVLCVMGMPIVQWETWGWIPALLETILRNGKRDKTQSGALVKGNV